ncbi:hypothetical protein NPIL_179261 [Nephila pilipes]|uniref:Uncharacterized protein n=1 Tax=Nephila pilipes TaxID=299642 RepID=A0A8X6NCD0_NEPPI|nr:hypothetical protein NPIL_179261 [Nephila pilipes]
MLGIYYLVQGVPNFSQSMYPQMDRFCHVFPTGSVLFRISQLDRSFSPYPTGSVACRVPSSGSILFFISPGSSVLYPHISKWLGPFPRRAVVA